ncbi:MAG TPA: hypothetical protein PLR01_07230 [Bacteroidales bacterium]|nr:hypothetical protein [Bacteroidales bacterium]
MKKNLIFILIFLMASCTLFYKNEGKISVKNGEGKKVSIPYQIANYREFRQRFSYDIFIQVVKTASEEAKRSCKYELTYEPVEIDMFSNNDTITTLLTFSAKNAFGVPDKERSYCKFKNGRLIDSF